MTIVVIFKQDAFPLPSGRPAPSLVEILPAFGGGGGHVKEFKCAGELKSCAADAAPKCLLGQPHGLSPTQTLEVSLDPIQVIPETRCCAE